MKDAPLGNPAHWCNPNINDALRFFAAKNEWVDNPAEIVIATAKIIYYMPPPIEGETKTRAELEGSKKQARFFEGTSIINPNAGEITSSTSIIGVPKLPVNEFVQQQYDLDPSYPIFTAFAKWWEKNIDGKIHEIRITARNLISGNNMEKTMRVDRSIGDKTFLRLI